MIRAALDEYLAALRPGFDEEERDRAHLAGRLEYGAPAAFVVEADAEGHLRGIGVVDDDGRCWLVEDDPDHEVAIHWTVRERTTNVATAAAWVDGCRIVEAAGMGAFVLTLQDTCDSPDEWDIWTDDMLREREQFYRTCANIMRAHPDIAGFRLCWYREFDDAASYEMRDLRVEFDHDVPAEFEDLIAELLAHFSIDRIFPSRTDEHEPCAVRVDQSGVTLEIPAFDPRALGW